MAIVKFSKDLLAIEPEIKDFVCSISTKPVLCVTTVQDAIDGVEAYLIESDEIPREGKVYLAFLQTEEAPWALNGFSQLPGLYKDKYVGYYRISL